MNTSTCGAGYPKALLDRGYSQAVRCTLSADHDGPHECGAERWLRRPLIIGHASTTPYEPLLSWLPQR